MPSRSRRRGSRRLSQFKNPFRNPFRKKKSNSDTSRKKTERKKTRQIQGTHVEIFGVENDKDVPQNYKEEYKKLLEELQFWPDEMLQFKMVGYSDEYGPLNVLSMLFGNSPSGDGQGVEVFDKNDKIVELDEKYDELDENGWFNRVEKGTQRGNLV